MPDSIQPWPEETRSTLTSFKVFHAVSARRQSPRTGKFHDFFVLETWDWCNVVAFTVDRELILVRQYRHGSEAVSIEIPGGLIQPREDPGVAALRELREETGFSTELPLVRLGEVNPNSAIFTNRCSTWLAKDCVRVGDLQQDAGEDIEVVTMPLEQVRARVRDGSIDHALVLAGLYYFELSEGS